MPKAEVVEVRYVKLLDVDSLARLAVVEKHIDNRTSSYTSVTEIARILGRTDSRFIVRLLEDNKDILVESKYVYLKDLNRFKVLYRNNEVRAKWQDILGKIVDYLLVMKKAVDINSRLWVRFTELKEARRRAYTHFDKDVETMYAESYDKAAEENKRDYSLLKLYLMYFPEAESALKSEKEQALDDFLDDYDEDDLED